MKPKKKKLFRGAATALVTPFTGDSARIDESAFRALVRMQRDAGISALVTAGTTGEAPALSPGEHSRLITLAKEEAPDLPLLAGCGAASTSQAAEYIRSAAADGADCALVVTPYYNKCSEEGLYRHYMTLAEASPIPLCLYEVPSRTGVSLSAETCRRLSAHENIIALKDARGDAAHTVLLAETVGDALTLYSGCDGMTVPLLAAGADGVISVLSNVLPQAVQAMCSLWQRGQVQSAAALQRTLAPLTAALFSEVSPIPVKALLAHLGLCPEVFRLPLCPPDAQKKKALLAAFDALSFPLLS